MTKVFGVHYITLKTGVKIEQFEEFLQRAAPMVESWPGVRSHVAKGERGDRTGRPMYIVVFDSVEVRDYYLPPNAPFSLDAQERFAAMGDFIVEWEQYATFGGDPILWTDYAVIVEI